jgi:hypothetical protein
MLLTAQQWHVKTKTDHFYLRMMMMMMLMTLFKTDPPKKNHVLVNTGRTGRFQNIAIRIPGIIFLLERFRKFVGVCKTFKKKPFEWGTPHPSAVGLTFNVETLPTSCSISHYLNSVLFSGGGGTQCPPSSCPPTTSTCFFNTGF